MDEAYAEMAEGKQRWRRRQQLCRADVRSMSGYPCTLADREGVGEDPGQLTLRRMPPPWTDEEREGGSPLGLGTFSLASRIATANLAPPCSEEPGVAGGVARPTPVRARSVRA